LVKTEFQPSQLPDKSGSAAEKDRI